MSHMRELLDQANEVSWRRHPEAAMERITMHIFWMAWIERIQNRFSIWTNS